MSIELNNESAVEVDEAALQRLAVYALDAMHVHPDAELAIVLVDEGAMEQLHVQWMDEPGPTEWRTGPEPVGVGPWPGGPDAWPDDPRYDPELLAEGDDGRRRTCGTGGRVAGGPVDDAA